MKGLVNTTKLTAAALILGVVASLFFWYLFIQKQKTAIDTTNEGRGFDIGIPTFGGGLGSTNLNIQGAFDFLSGSSSAAQTSTENTKEAPRLWQLSNVPSAGVQLFRGNASSTTAYFVERVSGNIFSANPKTGVVTRITNTLIPYVYEALWVNEKTVLLRSIDRNGSAATFLGTITSSTTTLDISALEGRYLDPGITTITASRDANAFFTLTPTSGGYAGIVTDMGSATPKRVWESSLGGWRSAWGTKEKIILYQHSAMGVTGSVYAVDVKNRTSMPVITSVAGLSAAATHDGSAVLFSEAYVDSLKTFIKKGGVIRPLSIKTLGEKCAWAPDNSKVYCAVPRSIPNSVLPDAWYRGEVHFDDEWWVIDPETGNAEMLISPESDFGVAVDVSRPTVDSENQFISFVDNKTGIPWVFKIKP